MKVSISIDGCDDSTHVEMNVSKDGLLVLQELEKLSIENSTYG